MRIGFFDYSISDRARPGKSGLSDIVWDIVNGLDRIDNQIYIAGPYTSSNYPVANVNVLPFNVPNYLYRNIITQSGIVLRGGLKLKKVGGFDLIHTPEYYSTALFTYLMPQTPIILTTPGNIFERIKRFNPYDPFTTKVYKWAARRSARYCAHIIATSKDMAKWWEYSGASSQKITVIPLPVDLTIFYHRENAVSQLGWNFEERNLLYVGRLAAENRVDLLLHAFIQLSKLSDEKVRLHIVGNGDMIDELKKIAEDSGVGNRVSWHGLVSFDLLPMFYSAADIFVYPRPTGAAPRVVSQAMACGAVIVAVESESISDYIQDGFTGYLVKSTDPNEIAQQLLTALQNSMLNSNLGKAALTFATENFSQSVVAKRIVTEVYEPIVNRKTNIVYKSKGNQN